jgi:hypothetical protein
MKGMSMCYRILAPLLWLLVSIPAHANWVKIASNEQSIFYLDPAISPKFENNITIWVLRDHNSSQLGENGAFLSSKDQIELDCGRQRIRRIYSSDHPKHMGVGPFVHSEHGPMSWNAVMPNTVLKRIFDFVCPP